MSELGIQLPIAMRRLPDTVVGIRDLLVREHVVGVPLDRESCPLANWLSARTGQQVRVGATRVWAGGVVVELPEAVAQFVLQFDLGTLPGKEALLA